MLYFALLAGKCVYMPFNKAISTEYNITQVDAALEP